MYLHLKGKNTESPVHVADAQSMPCASASLTMVNYCTDVQLCRRQGTYASATLAEAHRALLSAALANPDSTMFVLLSEKCIPLYHPALFWAQLMVENRQSRVSRDEGPGWRFSAKMATAHFQKQHWRKSSQWTALTRLHAYVVAHDDHVWQQFRAYCRTQVRAELHCVAPCFDNIIIQPMHAPAALWVGERAACLSRAFIYAVLTGVGAGFGLVNCQHKASTQYDRKMECSKSVGRRPGTSVLRTSITWPLCLLSTILVTRLTALAG